MKGIIYKAENVITGKIYIGETTEPLQERIRKHYTRSEDITKTYKFVEALREYKKKDWDWNILETFEWDNKRELKEKLKLKEREYISKNDSYRNGYNSLPADRSILSNIEYKNEPRKRGLENKKNIMNTLPKEIIEESKKLFTKGKSIGDVSDILKIPFKTSRKLRERTGKYPINYNHGKMKVINIFSQDLIGNVLKDAFNKIAINEIAEKNNISRGQVKLIFQQSGVYEKRVEKFGERPIARLLDNTFKGKLMKQFNITEEEFKVKLFESKSRIEAAKYFGVTPEVIKRLRRDNK